MQIKIFTASSSKCQLGAAQETSGSGQEVGSGLTALRDTNRADWGLSGLCHWVPRSP